MQKSNIFILLGFIALLAGGSCTTETGDTMRHVLYKTKDGKEILTWLRCAERADAKDGYLLYAGVKWEKSGFFQGYSKSSYTISVLPGEPEPLLMITLNSTEDYDYFGNMTGDAEPNGEWHEGGEFGKLIYDCYQKHKEEVLTEVYAPDLSRFNPQLQLSDNGTYYLLSCRQIDSLPLHGNGDIILECEFLSTSKLVNYKNELQSWTISKSLIHFIPSGNDYTTHTMRIKEYPAYAYGYGCRKPREIMPFHPDWESYNSIGPLNKKILDHYLETTCRGKTECE